MEPRSTTPSSLRYLDPAVLSGLAKHALNFSEPANRSIFAFGSSSIWGTNATNTGWSPFNGSVISQRSSDESSEKTMKPIARKSLTSTRLLEDGKSCCHLSQRSEDTQTPMTSAKRKPCFDSVVPVSKESSRSQVATKPFVEGRGRPTESACGRTDALTATSSIAKKPAVEPTLVMIPAPTACNASPQSSASRQVHHSGSESCSNNKPLKKKRRRIKHIEESKESHTPMRIKQIKSNVTQMSLGLNAATAKQANARVDGGVGLDDDMWKSGNVQGLVDTDELLPISTTPQGVNPWAYLWKPGAPRFEIDVVSCADRRAVTGYSK